ncbi:Tol-Pal system beta propeller repeat protein TolB [Ferriphaselus sp. R-1]|uniref:Tol-Pal system beta propeller repeat protein TolB n=1 Tax=Ferriphaselus sp. R-1 TaxID=1485544 RepID=UPI0005512E4B
MILRTLMSFTLLLLVSSAQAALNIQIIGAGERQIPVAIIPFAGEDKLPVSLSSVISADLARTGLFRLVDPAGKAPHQPAEVNYAEWGGVEAIAIGSVAAQENNRTEIRFRLLDGVKQVELLGQAVSGRDSQLRYIAHRIADTIYEKLTGVPGVFSTRIVYVNRNKSKFKLIVSDSDGYGEQVILDSDEPIMSPAWSPDGSHLAYVSFELGHAAVFVQSLVTGQRKAVASFNGSNSAPAWSPDGRQLALVLTRDGGSQIYLCKPDGSDLKRLTHGDAINTEPNFSPDGQYLLFTSDRGGSAQIYRMPVDGGSAQRVTFEGGQAFSPRHSPDGKGFVFTYRNGGRFYIATEDFETKQMQLLTDGGWEKRPSFAPNGKLVLFASDAAGRGILSTVSSDGKVKQRMSAQTGDVREPMWGPFLNQ